MNCIFTTTMHVFCQIQYTFEETDEPLNSLLVYLDT